MHSDLKNVLTESSFWANHKLLWLSETGSTNDDLKEIWRQPDYFHCIEVADTQTKGKGQYERKWESAAAGQCLMFSFSAEVKEYNFPISMIAGVAMAVTLEQLGLKKSDIWLKWPNDIWVRDRKLAGILTESSYFIGCPKTTQTASLTEGFRCVIGIGLNMLPLEKPESDFASLKEEGILVDRETVLCEFCKAWEKIFYMTPGEQTAMWNDFGGQFWKRSFVFDVPGRESFVGIPVRLEQDGGLIVKTSAGEENIIAASLKPL